MEQALEDLRSNVSEHEKKFNEGERQMRQLQEDMAGVRNQPSGSGIKSEVFPARDERIEKELQRVSDELRRQQVRFDQMQEDSIEDAKAIKNYLDEVHEMVTQMHQRQDSSPVKGTLASATHKGDMKVEVHSHVPRGQFLACLTKTFPQCLCVCQQMSEKDARNNGHVHGHVHGHASHRIAWIVRNRAKATNTYSLTTTACTRFQSNMLFVHAD